MSNVDVVSNSASPKSGPSPVDRAVADICNLNWPGLTAESLINVAWAYYYFSIQFRENLAIARQLFPDDEQLQELDRGERDTDNLSPWPGVARPGERLNHDEFMRRSLQLETMPDHRRQRLTEIGETYLVKARGMDVMVRALALASYEDGGLEKVFRCILNAPHWEGPLLQAFKHFLVEHITCGTRESRG